MMVGVADGHPTDGPLNLSLESSVAAALGEEDFQGALDAIALQSRLLVGTHQAAVSYIPDRRFGQGRHGISLSDKYAEYRSFEVVPTGEDIWGLILDEPRCMRMTDAEVQAHPRLRQFSGLKDEQGLEHPPMLGWLAVPILRRTGAPVGVLQLSDRFEGEFTERDQELLVGVARLIAATFELEYVRAELVQARGAYANLYDDAPDMYASIDPGSGRLRLCNQTLADRLGWSKDELIGKPVSELYHPSCHDDFRSALQMFRAEGHVENARLAVQTREGERIPVLLSATAVRDDDGRILYSSSSWRDISDLEEAESKLAWSSTELTRSNAELERFAYVASHDLQEPLRMVASFTQLLADDLGGALTDRQETWIGYAVDGAKRMQAMIRGLLAYSRVGAREAHRERVHLQRLVDDIRTDLSPRLTDVSGQLEATDLPEVYGDPMQLRRVLLNLITNGLKFTSDVPPVVRVTAEESDDGWVIAVTDNGRGIAREHFDKIFLAFQRLDSRDSGSGSGIGLAIVKRVVERHGGVVEVQSAPGQGATFRFTLPGPAS